MLAERADIEPAENGGNTVRVVLACSAGAKAQLSGRGSSAFRSRSGWSGLSSIIPLMMNQRVSLIRVAHPEARKEPAQGNAHRSIDDAPMLSSVIVRYRRALPGSSNNGCDMSAASVVQGSSTFVFTDIVGSTRLWERAPEAAKQALARHNKIMESIVSGHRGTIFKTVGDACCCIFADAGDAVRGAVAMQIALAAERWPDDTGELRIRVAIHTGDAIADKGDYFGPTLNRVARLMSAAHGGQIVVSAATARLLSETLANEWSLIDLGSHRFRDLTEPQHVFQLTAPGLEGQFPALASLDSRPNNLPSQLSTFIGRESELSQLQDALAKNRLVSLCGPGGIGKTRLAIHAAANELGRYADGAWIVRLADVTDPDLIPQTVASTLRITGVPGQEFTQTLIEQLNAKQMFLLLDNAEHVHTETARLVHALLISCPRLTILVTSRESLHVSGESVLRIGALNPQDAQVLFQSRAGLAQTDGFIEHICEELNGLPLAIELVAGRIGTLTTRQLDARLNTILPVLSSKDSSQEARHRTLQATIEWSYRLLNPKEQRFFALLCAFEGGFSLEACEAVAWAGEEDDPAYALLDALVDKSFVAAEPAGDTMRYRLLESLHGFGRARLDELDSASMARDLHFDYFKMLADQWGEWPTEQEEERYLQALALEIPNLRTALDWGLQRPDPRPAFELLLKIALYWQQHCNIAEARTWLERACAGAGESADMLHAKMLRRASTFATIADDYQNARAFAVQALEIFTRLQDRPGTAEALHNLAVIEQRSGSEQEAHKLYRQALEMFEETHHEIGTITALYNLALTAERRGDTAAAKEYLERGMSLCVGPAHSDRLATFWSLRAEIAIDEGDYDAAAPALERALEMKRALGDRHDEVEVLCHLSALQIRRTHWRTASNYAHDALVLARELGVPSLLICCFEVYAVLLDRTSHSEEARELIALSKAIRGDRGYTHNILSELALDLAVFADVPVAKEASREAIERACARLAADQS